jgi:Cof subfamily protein (haloacid dehalogenase superfamily)
VEDEHDEASLSVPGGELRPPGAPASWRATSGGLSRAGAPFKLLAVDLDGTLLSRDGVPHEADRLAIARLREAGIPTTIATGRLYSGSCDIAHAVGIEGPIACVDGSQIADTRTGREVYVRSIAVETAVVVRDLLADHGAISFLFAQDLIVHDPAGEPYAHYVRTWSPRIELVDRVTEHPHWEHDAGVMAVVALGHTEQIRSIVSTLRNELAHATFVVDFPVARLAGTHALVARAAGATKGTAVEWLARHHGITPREVVVVGDWVNDVPMFQTAGRSFVMGQAPEHVKRAATDRLLADLHTGGGIAEAIREAWGIF